MSYTSLQSLTIGLFIALLFVWAVAIPNKNEHQWALNPWLPTTLVALLWSIMLSSTSRGY